VNSALVRIMTQGVGGWVSPFVLRGSGKTSWQWGF